MSRVRPRHESPVPAILRFHRIELSAKRPNVKEQRDHTNALNNAHLRCPDTLRRSRTRRRSIGGHFAEGSMRG